MNSRRLAVVLCFALCLTLGLQAGVAAPRSAERQAKTILDTSGVTGGLVVHVGCDDGRLTAALRRNDRYVVQGLDADEDDVLKARSYIRSAGLAGPVSVDGWDGERLPYVDNLVSLLVSEKPLGVPQREVMRVLSPRGVAMVKRNGEWTKTVKPRPDDIDEWTHYMHDPSNNAVANDTVVGPPRRLRWKGGPKWGRHHEHMSSMNALASNGDCLFYVVDEGPRKSVLLPSDWKLVARDAFNGTILWKRSLPEWFTRLWPLKSGPAFLPRRLVATGDRVYITLGFWAPLSVLDADTGETLHTYDGTKTTEEVIVQDGTLFLVVNEPITSEKEYTPKHEICWDNTRMANSGWAWSKTDEKTLMAVDPRTGKHLWEKTYPVAPMSMAVSEDGVFFFDGENVVGLDRQDGSRLWKSKSAKARHPVQTGFAPTLVLHDGVVLFSGGRGLMEAFAARTGKKLWDANQPRSGHHSPWDLMVIDDKVWAGATAGGGMSGVFTGRDVRTGEVKKEFTPEVETYWFHQRCYQSKATTNYLLPSRTGIEFVDWRNETWNIHHWVRSSCLYGILPCNGMVYAAPHPCACYMESKLTGFNALAAAEGNETYLKVDPAPGRLTKGPAYGDVSNQSTDSADWPTYRHDSARSGHTPASVPAKLNQSWQTDLGSNLTSPVAANGKLLVAATDAHTVYALDSETGEVDWSYTAGGRVDSPPTIYRGRVLFGSADGRVYCLRASDGKLVWRFRAAPRDLHMESYQQVESVWPVHGSVLVQNDEVYCVAGRSRFLDGGLRLIRLDPETGKLIAEKVLDDRYKDTEKNLQAGVERLDMPVALPDILSSDGDYVYMRNQEMTMEGEPVNVEAHRDASVQGGPTAHLYSAAGFLDDSWFHRTYWQFGHKYVSGCNWWHHAGQYSPSGRLLVFDDEAVYGFGRKPNFWKWTSHLDYHVYSAQKPPSDIGNVERSMVDVKNTKSLNPAKSAWSAEAWVKAEKPDGVVLARGGESHGYSIYLKGGRPHFAVRISGKMFGVNASDDVVGQWTHLAGVLTADKQLKLYVDGKLAASGKAGGLIASDPNDAMGVGAETHSTVADYAEPFGLTGAIDDVRLYRGALSADDVKKHRANPAGTEASDASLVLHYTFEGGQAKDHSGHGNDGSVDGAKKVSGKVGKALRFAGWRKPSGGLKVTYNWSTDAELHVHAMVQAGDRLFVVGTPNVWDEKKAFYRPHDADVKKSVKKQTAALRGEMGSVLRVISTEDGSKLAEYKMEGMPRYDGMAAAEGRLFVATKDGRVVCMTGR